MSFGGISSSPAAFAGNGAGVAALSANVLVLNKFYQAIRVINARDGSRCQYCGKKMPTTELSLDHVVPKSQGGKSTWENIVCCCVKCNVKKGGRTPEQAHLHLVAKPHKPKRSPVINIRLADERYSSWKQFLDTAYWTVELK